MPTVKCCELDDDGDGNCKIHSSPGVLRHSVDNIILTRRPKYGTFAIRAKLCQEIKTVFEYGDNWGSLSDDKKESLEMIANKISRILNGDPNHKDSWDDIAGYAQLVADTLKQE